MLNCEAKHQMQGGCLQDWGLVAAKEQINQQDGGEDGCQKIVQPWTKKAEDKDTKKEREVLPKSTHPALMFLYAKTHSLQRIFTYLTVWTMPIAFARRNSPFVRDIF